MYYLHLNSNTLPHYIVAGCITPAFLIERRENDIQNSFPEHLLLSTKRWGDSNDCSILIALTESETLNLVVLNEEYLLFDYFIPLSRIVRIFFSSKEKAETVLWNIRNGAGFIPDKVVEIVGKQDEECAQAVNLNPKITNERLDELKKNLIRFNRLLGGLAFMRVALYDMNDHSINYPVNYIAAVSVFNEYIKKQFDEIKTPKDYKLVSIFAPTAPIRNYLGVEITSEILENEARNEKIVIDKKFGSFYSFENMPRNSLTYKLCLLYTYGKNKAKSIDDFLIDFFKGSDNEINEELAIIFGIHIGYGDLRNYYKIGNRRAHVKFELDSLLDLYILESVYQYVAYKNKNHERFAFLDMNADDALDNLNYCQGYVQYRILDKLIITKRKDYTTYHTQILKDIVEEIQGLFPKSVISVNSQALLERLSSKTKESFTQAISAVKEDILNEQKITSDIEKQKKIKEKTTQGKPLEETKYKEPVDTISPVEDKPITYGSTSNDEIGSLNSLHRNIDKSKLPEIIKKKTRKKDLIEIAESIKIEIPKNVLNKKIEEIQNYLLKKISDL